MEVVARINESRESPLREALDKFFTDSAPTSDCAPPTARSDAPAAVPGQPATLGSPGHCGGVS